MRIGHITNSYGRLIDFWASVELSNLESFELAKNFSNQLKWKMWSFPERKSYPFINQRLSKKVHIGGNLTHLLYRGISKLGVEQLLTHTEYYESQSKEIFKLINRQTAELLKEINQPTQALLRALNISKVSLDKLCLIYCKSAQSEDFQRKNQVNTEHHRIGDQSKIERIIDYLISKGFSVIRMGRHEHKIQGREGFFDYCSSPVRSDQNDLFLWANTTFGITSHGGANEPAFVFKTPLFFLDFGEYFNQINRISDINYLMLPKQWISRNGKLMKIEELFDTGLILGPSINWTQLRELGITFRMNTLQDTINALEDFIEEIDCNFSTLPTKIKESYLLADSKICISRYARMN